MNILTAEDNPNVQEAMQLIMEHWNYSVDIVSNGLEAVEKARSNQYDLCIMDINMPIMDGRQATREIRRELRYIPILALTANSGSERQECLTAGMDDFLEKPCDIHELRRKIIELTVKTYTIRKNKNQITIEKEMPMDQQL